MNEKECNTDNKTRNIEKTMPQGFVGISELIKNCFEKVEKLYENKSPLSGVPTGFESLDKLTAGLQPADLIVVAGRPSMGKTSFCLNIAQYAAIIAKVPVAIFTLESSKDQITIKMLCSEARVDALRLKQGFLLESDWPKLTKAAGLLSEAPIFIDATPAISISEIRSKAGLFKANSNVGLIIIDYLQLIKGRENSERREQEISEISHELKSLAKELDMPIIVISQLNRALESRIYKRPQLVDLRDSGAIEEDADLILFIYRDEVYNKAEDNPKMGLAEIIIGKHRNGPVGAVELAFLSKYTSFEELAPDYNEA